MEKLIELLNEYRTEKLRREMYVNGADKEAIELSEAERINEYEVSQTLDSQNYLKSFIKWLVENDKIDLEDQAMQYAKSDLSKFFAEWKDKNGMSDDYAMLLMLLAIQDEPISFLCEILK